MEFPIAIIEQAVDAHHDDSALVVDKIGHCAKRRLELAKLPIGGTANDLVAMTRFPESAFAIDEYMTEIIVVFQRIALEFLRAMAGDVESEEPIASRSHQEMLVVFLNDVVDAGNTLRTLHRNVLELVGDRVVEVQPSACSHPQVSLAVGEEIRDDIATKRSRVLWFIEVVRETISVVLVQTVFRAHPDVARLVLTDIDDLVARQLFRSVEMSALGIR